MYERAGDRLRMLQKEGREREQPPCCSNSTKPPKKKSKKKTPPTRPHPTTRKRMASFFQVAEIKQFIRRYNRSAYAFTYQNGDSEESEEALRDFAKVA